MADEGAEPIEIQGRPLACQFCGHSRFHTRTAQLNTATASFFGFDWANRSAFCHVCESCGFIHWFLPPD